MIHGLFGPRINLGRHAVQPFVTAKGGLINFRLDNSPATFGTFASSVSGLRENNVMGTFYAGGGLEGHLGPIGLRLDIGDEMYFNNGTHSNLKATLDRLFVSKKTSASATSQLDRKGGDIVSTFFMPLQFAD